MHKIYIAYIINGEEDQAKNLLQSLCMTLQCEKEETGTPCMGCHSCKQAMTKKSADIMRLDA